ncbi:MAG TPA: cupin domain-containing protein [Rhizomicrobium sp.]|nr:cupin domain-containing protein [Rhizomicrobium sp.]
MSAEAERLISVLKLAPHPEGGHYRETFRDCGPPPAGRDCGPPPASKDGDGRGHSSAIFFLLKAGEVSWWHRIDAAEAWHYHRGAPLELSIAHNGVITRQLLGAAIEKGETPQLIVPAGAWQMARSLGDYTLVGCTVAPGFAFARFELAPKDFSP